MPGTRRGGLKAYRTNKQRYGENYYKTIGRMGGLESRNCGFATMEPERLRDISRKGGLASAARLKGLLK